MNSDERPTFSTHKKKSRSATSSLKTLQKVQTEKVKEFSTMKNTDNAYHGHVARGVQFLKEVVKERQVVFESPVQSGLLTLIAQDRDRDRSIGLPRPPKTGPNRCRPVYIGLNQSWTGLGLNRSRTGLGPAFRPICSSIICFYEYYL